MSRPAIGQAVVTDPSSGRASGYVLVAASPSVRPEDARHLTAAPQVTDFLHLEKSPGPYFSFYRLPSGCWAAVKRFVRGTRRGAFNRVVVHTLVVPPAALGALAGEPWLLWTRCRFRPPAGGAELTPSALTERVGDPGLDDLDDLEVSTEGEPRSERAALLGRRRDFLGERWGAEELEERLRAVLAALAGGRRALLPQGAESEQLLSVAWSLLPVEDRLETPWTTHLAPAAGNLFHLASCPDPRALRNEQEEPDCWVLPVTEPVPDDAGEDGRTLARAFVAGEVDLGALDEGFELHGIRLSASGQTRRWIVWMRTGEGLFTPRASPGAGASVDELARCFHELRRHPRETEADPWLSPAHLLGVACATALEVQRAGKTADEALEEILQVLLDTHWHGALLRAETVAELAGLAPRGPETVPVAAALVGRTLPKPPGGRREREALLDLFAGGPPPLPDREPHPLLARVLADLGVDLAVSGSPRAEEAFVQLASVPGGLAAAAEKIVSRQGPFAAARAVLRAGPRVREDHAVARVAAECFFPLVSGDERLLRETSAEELATALAALESRPAALADVLRFGPEELYDAAAQELRRWTAEAPEAARGTAASLAADPEPDEDPGDPTRRRPGIAGLAERLSRLGAPARAWLPFAVAEADLATVPPRLAVFLAGTSVPEPEAREVFDTVADSFRRAVARGRLNAAHRALLEAASPGAGAHPEKAAAALARLGELAAPDFFAWAPTVARLARALDGSAPEAASGVRGNYWRALAAHGGAGVPGEALEMLDGLRGDDRRRVADLWLPEIARLEGGADSNRLISALGALVDPDNAEQRFHYNLGRLALGVRLEGLDLIEAVNQAGRLLRTPSPSARAGPFGPFMKRALNKLLPPAPGPRAGAVVELLLSPRVPPSIKRVIETELCDASLKGAGRDLPGALPRVEELAGRGPLLLRVAAQLGGQWRTDPRSAEAFLREAGRLGRYDAVAAFLATAESGRPGFLEATAVEGDASLIRKITRATLEHLAARLYLRPYAAALGRARPAIGRRRRR